MAEMVVVEVVAEVVETASPHLQLTFASRAHLRAAHVMTRGDN